jgi:hypothetical protein
MLIILFLSPTGSLGFSERQWELADHFNLWVNQWELTYSLTFLSCFLYNLKFQQTDCSACHLISAGFSLGLLFNLEDGGDTFPMKHRQTFSRPEERTLQRTSNPASCTLAVITVLVLKHGC